MKPTLIVAGTAAALGAAFLMARKKGWLERFGILPKDPGFASPKRGFLGRLFHRKDSLPDLPDVPQINFNLPPPTSDEAAGETLGTMRKRKRRRG
jgi:hypothetical protein